VIDLDAVVACVAAGIYGDDRMSRMERDGALASLSTLVEEVKRLEAENASLVQTSADLCAECGWRFFVPGDGCQKCELDRLREDAVVARSVETTLTVEVERLRTNAAARERFLRREGDLLRAAERERDDLRKEVQHLRSPVPPDEVCAACGCARFRHEQWRVDGAYKTKCWGGGYDLDDCGCSQFVRLTHDGRKP
jgi:hypothetical protein